MALPPRRLVTGTYASAATDTVRVTHCDGGVVSSVVVIVVVVVAAIIFSFQQLTLGPGTKIRACFAARQNQKFA